MKIALILNSFPKTSETFIFNKVKELSSKGNEITLIVHAPSSEILNFNTDSNPILNIVHLYKRRISLNLVLMGLWVTLSRNTNLETTDKTFTVRRGLKHFFVSQREKGLLLLLQGCQIVHFEYSGIAVTYRRLIPPLCKMTKVVVSCRGSAELVVPILQAERKAALVEVLNHVDLIHCVSGHISLE